MKSILMGQRWLVIALLVFAGVYAGFVYDAHRLPPAARRLRAADIPISVQELEEKYTPEPVEDNGAFLYIEALEKLRYLDAATEEETPVAGELSYAYGQEFTERHREGMRAYIEMNAEPLALVLEAQKKPFVRLPVNRYEIYTSYVQGFGYLQSLVHCVMLESCLSGDMDALEEMGIAALRLYEMYSEGALFTDDLMAGGLRSRAIENLEYCLYFVRPPAGVIHRWLDILGQASYGSLEARKAALQNEVAHSYMIYVYEGPFFDWQEVSPWELKLNRLRPEWTQDHYFAQNGYVYIMDQFIAATTGDIYEAVNMQLLPTAFNDPGVIRGWYVLVGMTYSIYKNVYLLFARNIARTATAQAALASLLYEEDHGRLPDALEDLVPDYLDAVPRDPFTPDGTIRYRIREHHAVFYSVGPNEQDDGGTEVEGGWLKCGDIIFRLPFAERRDE